MSKLNYQKLSKQTSLNKQAIVNRPAKKRTARKAPRLETMPRSKFGEIKPQSLWQLIGTETVFLSGRYKSENIGKVFEINPEYKIVLLGDILDRGIMLSGGGGLIKGLDERIRLETSLPVHIADDPLTAVVRGTGKILENLNHYSKVLIKSRRY